MFWNIWPYLQVELHGRCNASLKGRTVFLHHWQIPHLRSHLSSWRAISKNLDSLERDWFQKNTCTARLTSFLYLQDLHITSYFHYEYLAKHQNWDYFVCKILFVTKICLGKRTLNQKSVWIKVNVFNQPPIQRDCHRSTGGGHGFQVIKQRRGFLKGETSKFPV